MQCCRMSFLKEELEKRYIGNFITGAMMIGGLKFNKLLARDSLAIFTRHQKRKAIYLNSDLEAECL